MLEAPSAVTSGRLALYLYAAERAPRTVISSEEIAASARLNATQVRRDLSKLSLAGKRGVGYVAADLAAAIRRELKPYHNVIADVASVSRERSDQLAEVAERLERS